MTDAERIAHRREYLRQWRATNPRKRSAQDRKRAAAYHAAHRDVRNAAMRARSKARVRNDLVDVLKTRVGNAKRRAAKHGWAFDLTYDYVRELYDKQPFCAITKRPFDISNTRTTVSLDRIDSRGGYTVGNVRLVHWQVNAALNAYGEAAFYEMCETALKNRPV